MSYAFVDRKCYECDGCGCELCYWTGLIGELQEVPDIEQPKPTEFGIKLRQTRQNRMVSIRELAQKFGWKPSHLSDIETGRIEPTNDEIEQIEKWESKIC